MFPAGIPLDNLNPSSSGWATRWKDEYTALTGFMKEQFNINNYTLGTLQNVNTSTINSVLFYNLPSAQFKQLAEPASDAITNDTILPKQNTVLAVAGINYNCCGPSVREERADRFGDIQFFADEKFGNGFTINVGATHNYGGQSLTAYGRRKSWSWSRTYSST